MNRRTLLVALGLSAFLPAAQAAAQTVHRYNVLKAGRLVLTVSDVPGPIVSTAALPPGTSPAQHPFLSAAAQTPEEENALYQILEQSKDFDDFLRRLRAGGYTVQPS
jgi:hypothetical protein